MTFTLLTFFAPVFAQTITPQQQVKIDSLLLYVNAQRTAGKAPDQHYIDSVNAVIRNMNAVAVINDSLVKTDSITLITKQSLAGSSFTVPAGKVWTIKRVYVNDGGSYSILTSIKFDKPFTAGETFFTPSWSADAELLNADQSACIYIYQIEESNSKK